jgi:hypothetical protein
MTLFIDPLYATILVAGGIFFVSYMLGKSRGEGNYEKTIEITIDHLIEQGFIKTKNLPDGEVEMIQIVKNKR